MSDNADAGGIIFTMKKPESHCFQAVDVIEMLCISSILKTPGFH